ncbi:MAG: RNA polymerase sigma factor [Candidatus Pseudobacter hemicellulosilyticus]|uniref:RNA polymerase sigma factor n=1 Tax=Candidatus Pseudobacter hemicellulosilyticus TaxID=3121375 RepID=A0AAJ5WTN1_9BACT|nr:MAG: RNA polymerase sigma factor [Pseudobacter sp.]
MIIVYITQNDPALVAQYPSYDEKELLLLVASGNEQAFRTLVHDYSGLVFKFIYQHLEDRPLAEEIVQDIFLRIWLSREKLGQLHSFRSFLLIVSRNHVFNAIKKMVREKNREWDWLPSPEPNESSIQEQEQLFQLVEQAVEQLPPQQQKAWTLCRQTGLKYEQAAAEMHVSRDAVKKYLRYANDSIKKYVLNKTSIGCWCLFFFSR